MMRGWFVTGTDTGVGKTLVTCALLHVWRNHGDTVVGMKPVASGCQATAEGLRSEDALALAAASSVDCAYEDINPYAFGPPIAPHVAARAAGVEVSLHHIISAFERVSKLAEIVLVEGVGGWQVPLNARDQVADLAAALRLPVIMVVGMRLGCINHALLTAESIARSNVALAGWIASAIDPHMDAFLDNVETLRSRLDAPCLGVIPFLPIPQPALASPYLDVTMLSSR